MKIGLFAGSLSGSSKTMVVPLAKGLAQRGHEVYVLRLKRALFSSTEREGGLAYHVQPTLQTALVRPFSTSFTLASRHLLSNSDDNTFHPYDTIRGNAIRDFVSKKDLDVVYLFHNFNVASYLYESLWRNRSLDTRFIINLVGFGIDRERGGGMDTFPYQDYIFSNPRWHAHIAATQFEKSRYEEVYNRLSMDENRIFHLPHSIDEDIFGPDTDSEFGNLDFREDDCIISYPVHVYRRKNVELGIRALARSAREGTLSNFKFVVAGEIWDDDYYSELVRLADDQGIGDSLVFLEGIPHSDMPTLLSASDLILFPSHQETFGIGIVEALACGTPVVGPKYIPPTREVLESVPGGYAAEKSPDSFAKLLETALGEAPSPRTVSQHALDRFGNRSVAREFEQILSSDVVSEPIRASPDPGEVRSIDWEQRYQDTQSYEIQN